MTEFRFERCAFCGKPAVEVRRDGYPRCGQCIDNGR